MRNEGNLPCTVILCQNCLDYGESVNCINCEGAGTLCVPNAKVEPSHTIIGFARGGLPLNQGNQGLNRKKIRLLIVAGYAVFAPLTYGALLADIQNTGLPEYKVGHCRSDMGAAAGMALIPIFWVLHPFLTGFYEHGLQFTCPSAQEAKP